MGNQDEYLRNFTVLLTEKGVVPLTDPMQIAVYDELCSGSKRPSDVSASLGIPSSSLHFVLDKMTDSGVIVRYKPDADKKSVYYSNLALKIAGSEQPREGAEAECEDTFRDPSRYYSGMSSVANMLDQYSAEIGLSLDQLRVKYADELADSMKIEIGSGSLEDSILEIKERFARITGFRFSVFAPRFKVVYERVEKRPEPYINMSLHQTGEVSRFLMVELDGSVGLITSPVQMDIVDAVYERPLCITDIVNKVEAPRSTVTSNILRMVEDGVISVFYSESGTAYYGMSCSILMKKSRGLNRDNGEIREILSSTRKKDGAFMEGYLLYLLSSLKGLGFDTDYMMVVLGAKFMRVAGNDGPRNFDVFFGKMSDIAKAIGLSLNVVSVYPLTIGITSDDPESEMSPAMTFVKGMAHQGLEMASNGIFVRVSEDTPADRKVSFKEIYPALSMTPLEGISVEGLADAEASKSKKKRTSSVKTALLNRSAKEGGRPVRTVRYITGMVMMAFVAAILIFGVGALNDQGADADQMSVNLAPGCNGVLFYDDTGAEIQMPMTVDPNETVEFTVSFSGDTSNIGVVENGVAYPLDMYLQGEEGVFTMTVDQDITFQPITLLEVPEGQSLGYSLYCFSSAVSESYAYTYSGYIPADEYAEMAGGLWVTSGTVVSVTADEGSYISTGDEDPEFLYDRIVCDASDVPALTSADLPRDYVNVHLEGNFEADGRFVSGVLRVAEDSTVSLRFVSTNGPVSISLVTMGGEEDSLVLDPMDRTVTFEVDSEDVVIKYRHVGIY